jgi:hypothetical protein
MALHGWRFGFSSSAYIIWHEGQAMGLGESNGGQGIS